jgi:oxygen-independent coproporphyrinogen-3 oxidase
MLPIMDQKLAEYAAWSLPRCTSYPTARYFKDQINGEKYGDWLTALPEQAELSLYLHVPYCTATCHYCGCHTKATLREAPVRAYAEMLMAELRLALEALGQRRGLKHIHWGGGTPNLLPRECFKEIANIIQTRFEILPTCEHTIELNPRTVTHELAKTLAEIGVNRVSLGIQDFNPDVQLAIGRVQPFAQVEHAVSMIKDAGLTHICFDLMYRLPHQGEDQLTATIELATSPRPSRIALFGYAHVPWMKNTSG